MVIKVGDVLFILSVSMQILCLSWGQRQMRAEAGTEDSQVFMKGQGRQK